MRSRTWTLASTLCLMLLRSGVFAQPTAPNLTPLSPSSAPLLQKLSVNSATRIPTFYCEGIPLDQEMEVDVPAFDWGVANDDRVAVQQPFSVAILDDASKSTPLAVEVVQSIPRSGTRVFRNWPGRPTRVRVINVTASNPRFASEHDSTPGCYIPTALIGSVTLDPRRLIIRVDSGGQITERVEKDNELRR